MSTYVPTVPEKSGLTWADPPIAYTPHSTTINKPLGHAMAMYGGILQELPICLGPDAHGESAGQSSRIVPRVAKGSSLVLLFLRRPVDWQGRGCRLSALLLLPRRCFLAGDSRSECRRSSDQ